MTADPIIAATTSSEDHGCAEFTWDTMDRSEAESVEWHSLGQVLDDINDSFAPGEGAGLLIHRVLAANCDFTGEPTGGVLVCGTRHSEQGFVDRPWSERAFGDIDSCRRPPMSLDRVTTEALRWHRHVGDCNHPELKPESFDLLIASHGAHQVANLDELFRQARQGLKPGGIMYLYEWIGPPHLRVPRRNRLVATVLLLALFPRRATRTTRGGKVKGLRYLQSPSRSLDPGSAGTPLELRLRFQENFEILSEYQHGGLTYPMFEGMAHNMAQHQPRTRRRIRAVIAIEKWLTRWGIIHPLFTIAVGRRRPGPVVLPVAGAARAVATTPGVPSANSASAGGATEPGSPAVSAGSTATVTQEEILTEIGALTAANRAEPSVVVERRLVDLRHRAFLARDHRGDAALQWPPEVPPRFADVTGIPEIDVDSLDVDTLRAGILGRGSLVVRNAVDPAGVERLREAISASLAAFDAAEAGTSDPETDPWFHPFTPAPGSGSGAVDHNDRYWARETGGMFAADSPRALFTLLEVLDNSPILDVVAAYLEERPALSVKKTTLRRVDPVAHADWHQDGAFLGADVRSVNVWIALTHCGIDAPSMDIVARRLEAIEPTGLDGALFDWSVSESTAIRVAGPEGIERPVFAPGDVILFDHMNLHRTSCGPEFTRQRFAIEAWLFAPSHYPIDQGPILT